MEIVRIGDNNLEEYRELLGPLLGGRFEEEGLAGLECFAAIVDDKICGLVAMDVTGNIAVIEVIYIVEELRFIGYGSKLLTAAELALIANGYDGVCALYYKDPATGINEYDFETWHVDDFFRSKGYLVMEVDEDEDEEDEEKEEKVDEGQPAGGEKEDTIRMMYATKSFV